MTPEDRPRMLSPDRVEWVPSSPDELEVRVFGTWQGPTVPRPAVLVVGETRVEALSVPPGHDVPPAWSAAFRVPVEVRSGLERGEGVLLVGAHVVGLPPATPGRMEEAAASSGGTLVDPEVLAERRARRAEIAEESAADHAASAEHTHETLRTQLQHLEQRLARAAEERDALAARVADAERRLRLTEQREEAERRRRGELEEELASERRAVEQELRQLGDRLSSAVEVTEALERELRTARRREEAERAAREHVDAQLRVALERVAALEGAASDEAEELRRQAGILTDRLAEAEVAREGLRRRLEEAENVSAPAEELEALRAEIAELRRRLDETLAALQAEREAHAATEHARQLAVQRTQEARAAAERSDEPSARERELAEQVARLEAEIAERAETHRRVQAAIEAIRGELGRVREQVLESQSATPVVEELTERVGLLEELLRRRDAELEATRTALAAAERAADDVRSQTADADHVRAGLESRIRELSAVVAEMRERLRETTADFERRLGEERARREAAEAELAALRAAPEAPAFDEPDDVEGDDALEALIAGLREQVDSAREQLRAWDEPGDPPQSPEPPPAPVADEATRERLKAIEAELRASTPDPEATVPASAVIASLQEAADRLRAAAQEQLEKADAGAADPADAPRVEDVGAPQPPESPRVEDVAAPPPPADEPPESPPVEAVAAPSPPSADALAESPPFKDAAAPPDSEPLGSREVDFGAAESTWLKTAVERLAQSDPARAADLLVALLPVQATSGVNLTYVLTAPTLGAVRVALSSGTAKIERRPESLGADARISGSIATLAPLVAGGGGFWPKGVRIEGAKRPARRLLRRRRPVGLADFALITPPPAPGLVLAAIAAGVEPIWTRGHRFGVLYAIDEERWTVLVAAGRPLVVTDADKPHAATVTVARDQLLPVLHGAASDATVAGDRRAVDVLHAWFDRARGVAAG